jgi:hypothetical protein
MVGVAERPRPLISVFSTGAATFSFKKLLIYPHEAESRSASAATQKNW